MRKSRQLTKDMPLLDWQPPLLRDRRRRRRPILVGCCIGIMLLGFGATLDLVFRPAPRLVWNASASAPIGLWHVHTDAALHSGDMVLAHMPEAVRQLAADRRYIPANVPLIKRIAAREGDTVCALFGSIYVNGSMAARRLVHDRAGRPLPWWRSCTRLRGGQYFLLMDRTDSFDSRYFGPVDEAAIIGKATPLWLR